MWVGKSYKYGKGPQARCWLLLLAACKDYSQLTNLTIRLLVCATETGWDELFLINGPGGLDFWHHILCEGFFDGADSGHGGDYGKGGYGRGVDYGKGGEYDFGYSRPFGTHWAVRGSVLGRFA